MTTAHDPLFSPLAVGSLVLPNRVVMAPLTRCRASDGRVPNPLMAEYYRQRANAGLILSEATAVHPMGVGYPDTPGIWSDAQVNGWKLVTDAVHAEGGKIFLQLWHVGRISDPIYLDGALPVAPSAVAASGHVSLVRPLKEFVTPRALEESEIPGVIAAFREGAARAMDAGFDGVELHAANGYLIDQFLQDTTNKRQDGYGGSIANRSRFLFEVASEVASVWGPDRVGVHLAPRCDAHDMGDSDPTALFTHVAKGLGEMGLAFLCARESHDQTALGPVMKKAFGGVFIANEGFTGESARAAIISGVADAVAFGKAYIANPDLAARLAVGLSLNDPRPELFYGNGPDGYTDYPPMD